jgi:hypothetical protein
MSEPRKDVMMKRMSMTQMTILPLVSMKNKKTMLINSEIPMDSVMLFRDKCISR